MKHNLNHKVIATGLFNVADQSDELDRVRDALRSLNHIVMDSGQFRVLIQSKKLKNTSASKLRLTTMEGAGFSTKTRFVLFFPMAHAMLMRVILPV